MLNLIHNLRFDRSNRESKYSFKKDLDNQTTSELMTGHSSETLGNKYLASNWLLIYRKQ